MTLRVRFFCQMGKQAEKASPAREIGAGIIGTIEIF